MRTTRGLHWLRHKPKDLACYIFKTLFDEEAPIIASSSGHGNNATNPREDSNVDVDLNYMDEDIFDDT